MWFLLHREGLSLMDGDGEVRFQLLSNDSTTLDLTSMVKDAGTLVWRPLAPRPKAKAVPAPSKEEHPRGVWIWNLADLHRDYLDRLVKCGVGRVYLKVFDDASKGDGFWSWQCSPAIVKSFNERGIEVWGWGYHFDKVTQIDVVGDCAAVERAIDCGLGGYVVDVEDEIKDPATHAQLVSLLRRLQTIVGTLGYTSHGAPQYHPEIPWKLLDEHCDLAFPQMYFEKWTYGKSDEAEVEAAFAAHKRLGLKKPILPIWGSESDTKAPASAKVLQYFLNAYPGSSLWRAPNAGERGEAFNLDYRGALSDDVVQEPPRTDGLRERVVDLARERCSKGRAHNPGNIIDTEVLDPLRPVMVRLGHLAASDKDGFFNWCSCNVTKIYRDAGIKVPDVPLVNGKPFWASVALVDTYAAWAKSIGAWRTAAQLQPGDACVYDWDGNSAYDHIGIVLQNNGASFLVAEGNKSNREVIITRAASLVRGGVNVEILARSLS